MSLANLLEALAQAQGELEHAKKESLNPHFRTKYANIASCMDAIRPVFSKYGLSIMQLVLTRDGKHYLRTILGHKSGETVESEMQILTTRDDPQGLGSGITYARRYALMAMVGLASEEDDDDGHAASSPTAEVWNGSYEHKKTLWSICQDLGIQDWAKENKEKLLAMLDVSKPELSKLRAFLKEIRNENLA